MFRLMESKTETSNTRWRFMAAVRRAALLLAIVGGIVLAAPMGPAWAGNKKSDNSKFVPKEEGDSYVTAYLIVVVSMMLGMTAICRKSYRTTDPKRPGSER
jgi:hypothetical protein